jgi:hypothetical protein
MADTLRPLTLGQLLDETFDIYRRNFLLFVGISLVPNLAQYLLALAVAAGAHGKPGFVLDLFVGLSRFLAPMVVSAVVTAATTFAVSDIYLDRSTSIKSCFSRVAGKLLRVVYVSVIRGLIVLLGMLFLVVPGIYAAGKYALAIPAVVLENSGSGQALARSAELTTDYLKRTIFIYFLPTIFAVVMVTAFTLGLDSLGPGILDHFITRKVLKEVIAKLGGIVFDPISAIGLTLAYYDLRVRKEAFDIEHMINLITGAETLAEGTSAR